MTRDEDYICNIYVYLNSENGGNAFLRNVGDDLTDKRTYIEGSVKLAIETIRSSETMSSTHQITIHRHNTEDRNMNGIASIKKSI
jgi:hypothetical protein